MTGAVMRETETLYSALGKKGRMGAGGSEWGRIVWDCIPSSLSLSLMSPCLSLSLHPPHPSHAPSPPTSRDAHSFGIWGCARIHTQSLQECVCMWTCEMAERSRSVTDMHVRVPWIQHPGTPLLFFFFFLFFLKLFSFLFYYCYFLILFEYFWFLVQKKKIILSVVLSSHPLALSVFFLILSSNLDLLSFCPFHTIFLSLHHHHRACFGYERSWNSRAQI